MFDFAMNSWIIRDFSLSFSKSFWDFFNGTGVSCKMKLTHKTNYFLLSRDLCFCYTNANWTIPQCRRETFVVITYSRNRDREMGCVSTYTMLLMTDLCLYIEIYIQLTQLCNLKMHIKCWITVYKNTLLIFLFHGSGSWNLCFVILISDDRN